MTKTDTPVGEARTVALSAIHLEEEFNPRQDAASADIDRLADSLRRHGPLVPLIVAPNGDDGYRLIAGERRYRAARQAGLAEVPVVVRSSDGETDGLAVALIENIAREHLNAVEEARGFRRLMDEQGLNRNGVAELLSIAQKRVTERLRILDVPEELHPRIASGDIPPGAIKALVALAAIHPDLPGVAVALVDHEVDERSWEEPVTWSDVAADPIGVVAGAYDDARALPDGVYLPGERYPVERFSLSEKANADLAKYAELVGVEPAEVAITFGRESVEDAAKLGAYHAAKEGYRGLIVGQDVADQLAGDHVTSALKAERRRRREMEAWERDRGKTSGQGPQGAEAPSAEEAAEQRRRQREADAEARRSATAYNHELGAACMDKLSRVRVDDRVVKLLACVDVQCDLEQIAMRGARYGFPGWTEEVQQKNGRTKVTYRDRAACTQGARTYIAGAKSAAEIAGRLVALIAMARYAKEEAVANSNRTGYYVAVSDYYSTGLPWSQEVIDIIDDICADRLPATLTKEARAARAKARKQAARLKRSTSKRTAAEPQRRAS